MVRVLSAALKSFPYSFTDTHFPTNLLVITLNTADNLLNPKYEI